MIRRAANASPAAGQPSVPGFILAWLVKVDANGNQTLNMVFEENVHGFVSEVPAVYVQFQDGLPPVIPVID